MVGYSRVLVYHLIWAEAVSDVLQNRATEEVSVLHHHTYISEYQLEKRGREKV